MNGSQQITRMLHDEHFQTIAALERLERLFAQHSVNNPPNPLEPAARATLGEVAALCGGDMPVHFAFEEDNLFPRLEANGDDAMCRILIAEHAAILPLAERLAQIIREAGKDGLDAAAWPEFRRLGDELIERLIGHIQKEEMGLLPAIDDLLESEQDWELAQNYAEAR